MTGAFEILGRDGKRLAVSDAGRLVAGPSQGAPGRVVIAGEPQPGLWLREAADRGTAISIADEPAASGQRPLGLLASARDDGFELRLPDGERPLELPQDGRDGAPLRVGPEPAVFPGSGRAMRRRRRRRRSTRRGSGACSRRRIPASFSSPPA